MTNQELDDLVKDDVLKERQRQDNIWGITDHPNDKWNTILSEEVGEVARAILNKDHRNLYDELIQVSATAQAWAARLKSQGQM